MKKKLAPKDLNRKGVLKKKQDLCQRHIKVYSLYDRRAMDRQRTRCIAQHFSASETEEAEGF
jgi:hypothetical protein